VDESQVAKPLEPKKSSRTQHKKRQKSEQVTQFTVMLDAYLHFIAEKHKASHTHLFFRLKLVPDLDAEDRQQNTATQWQSEDFRVDKILNALHLPLRQTTRGNFRDNLDDKITVGKTISHDIRRRLRKLTHLSFNGS
jgi:hypothetical protein